MKVTKELLEHLKVRSISIIHDGTNRLCFLDRIEKGTFTFSTAQKIGLMKGEKISFQVDFFDEGGKIEAELTDFGEDWLTVVPETETENTRVKAFLTIIADMEAKYESFGRRKEERVKIGKEKYADFGLSGIEQTVFLPGIKLAQPCVVLDASVHGICVITPRTKAIQEEEIFCIKLNFKNPEQSIILKAHKVYSRQNKTNDKIFCTLSCQLLEPVHFAWKERVIAIIEKTESRES